MSSVAEQAMINWYNSDSLRGVRHKLVMNLRIGYAKRREHKDLLRYVHHVYGVELDETNPTNI